MSCSKTLFVITKSDDISSEQNFKRSQKRFKNLSPAVRTLKNQSQILTKTYGPLPVSISASAESKNDLVSGQIRTGAIYLATLLVFLWWQLGH